MALTAEQFNAADPEVRSFYQNFYWDYLYLYYPGYYAGEFGEFSLYPVNLCNRVLLTQYVYGITQNINLPIIWENEDWLQPPDSIPRNIVNASGYYDAYYNLATYGDPPPREKLKIKRTYWTGIARRRRNLA